MIRVLPDGSPLCWKLTLRAADEVPSVIPFLIDWGDTPHPSATASHGAVLLAFEAETPDLSRTRAILDALDVHLQLHHGARTALSARIRGPRGEIVL